MPVTVRLGLSSPEVMLARDLRGLAVDSFASGSGCSFGLGFRLGVVGFRMVFLHSGARQALNSKPCLRVSWGRGGEGGGGRSLLRWLSRVYAFFC